MVISQMAAILISISIFSRSTILTLNAYMINRIYYSWLILVSLICNKGIAQQASYFMLGEQQFRGIQVYDVVQDPKNNYYFATSRGIYRYDFTDFTLVDCKDAKSRSVFNFVVDNKGTIYCHNLNNQIFLIKNDSCKLFYELKSDELSPDISLSITSDNELLISAGKLLVLDEQAHIKVQYNRQGYYIGPPFLRKDKSLLFHLRGTDTLVQYHKGKFSKLKLTVNGVDIMENAVLKIFRLNNVVYALDLRDKGIYIFDENSIELKAIPAHESFGRSGSVRLYTSKGKIWVAGSIPGVAMLDDPMPSKNATALYEDYFISDVYEDHEGNILLSTFDKGILVVQDLTNSDVINSFRDDPVTSLKSDVESGLWMGTSKGYLLKYNNKRIDTLNNKGERPIEGIYAHPKSDLVLFDNGFVRAYHKKDRKTIDIVEASLKDLAFISAESFFIGTNIGVMKVDLRNKQFSIQKLKTLNQRIYSLDYDSSTKTLYASASEGLLKLDPEFKLSEIKFKSERIYPMDIKLRNGSIYIATIKHGLVRLRNDNNNSLLLQEKSKSIEQMEFYQDKIIGKTSDGLYMFDSLGRAIRNLQSEFGFSDKGIIDFVLQGNTLWVSHSGGVQPLDLRYSKVNVSIPKLEIRRVLVNETAIAPNSGIKLQNNESKLEFELLLPTLRHRPSITYYYKLSSNQENKNSFVAATNRIAFDALAADNYTVTFKALINGNFSNEVIFSFSILKPFYLRNWFILLSATVFIFVVYVVYRLRLKKQQERLRRLNELNASKLTAIQSQMNPHFMFNALNSIQDLVLKGDVENSYSYITTFSNMVRRTLDYSDKDFIEFEQEIKLLELYLSLEKLRFKSDFQYSIDTGNVEDIMLPPMIIQPFVENALVHGLLHKTELKKLSIRFELEEHLICTIEDNGVGRKHAIAVQQRKQPDHKSFSGKAIKKRFEILADIYEGEFGYSYVDLYEHEKPTGTKVILFIPFKRKY
jgi:hypothetical protein